MHALSITFAILATALLSSAKPTGTSNLVPRACTTVFPTFIDLIDQANPTTNTDGMQVTVALDPATGNTFTRRDALVRFDNIPAGSYACQLEAVFPAGATVTSTGASQVNVFSLDRLAEPTDTYATAPNNVGLFGTITFASDPNTATTRVINSAACAPSLSYRLSLASDSTAGSVSFAEVANSQGLQITFNC